MEPMRRSPLIPHRARTGICEPLIGPLWQAASELTLPSARERVEVRASRLGDDAEIRGAVLLALQRSQQSYRVVHQI
jgi:hypothetical protein